MQSAQRQHERVENTTEGGNRGRLWRNTHPITEKKMNKEGWSVPLIWADSWALPENLSPSISRPFLPQPHVASALSLYSPPLFLGLPFLPLHSPSPSLCSSSFTSHSQPFLSGSFSLSFTPSAVWFLQCVPLMNSELRHSHVLIICCSPLLALSLSSLGRHQKDWSSIVSWK